MVPLLSFLLLLTSAPASPPQATTGRIDFASQIRPILTDRCFQCHGPDAASVAADLRLDVRDSAIDDLARVPAAIVPGDSAGSELLSRITHASAKRVMPPPESKLSLTDEEIGLLARWIDEGAEYTEHWSFAAPIRHGAPDTEAGAAWARDPLDLFVHAKLEEAGLAPAPPADPATLLRRVHLDLTGLPPTVLELDAYLRDEGADRYERAVERLLASQRHAEHMAAGWLDVARYADTFGYQSDVGMNVWPWRDWLIGAFAANLPYDEFVTQQLAGDLLPEATQETRLATAFNRLHRQTNEGGSVEEEYRVESVCDRVETMAGAFLGLTIGCARCHDHKFDPITQKDYFSLFAFFDDIDESGLYSHFTNAVPTPALDLPTDEQVTELSELEARVAELEATLPPLDPESDSLVALDLPVFVDFESPARKPNAHYVLGGEPAAIERAGGVAYRLSGENAVAFPGTGIIERSEPISVGLRLCVPNDAQVLERAVVIHRTKSWTDSGSRGYQMLIDDGHLLVALVHFWPGDAIAIRSADPLPIEAWTHVAFTYDGSSRAAGLKLYLDGVEAPVEVIRDHLTRTIRGGSIGDLTIGSRFRDKGFRGGGVDDVFVCGHVASDESIAVAARGGAPLPESLPEEYANALAELQAARERRDRLRDGIRQIMAMEASPDLPAARHVAHVLHRGDYKNRGDAVEPATPEALPRFTDEAPSTRLDLARWLTHPDHPLTTRVQIDRLWRQAFGVGLVPTPEDMGSQCQEPVHLALLDTLTRDFVDSGWDYRAMLRRFALSATYRQSSRASEASLTGDPDGSLFSRAATTRRSAEVVRDAALFAAGLLREQRGGPSVYPYQPPGLWQEKRGVVYPVGRGQDLTRRSMYSFWRRTSPPPTMTMFNAPSREVCTVKRGSTSTPLQTLALWNDPQFVAVAAALGAAAVDAGGDDIGKRVDYLFRALLTREPLEGERNAMAELLDEQREIYRAAPAEAVALAGFDLERAVHPVVADAETARSEPVDETVSIEVAATAVVASTLLGFQDVVQRR
ncbi:Planctomycete cytochrome C [Planctomycetes bacterium Poly30]|uniref:Planctomycete cytochrome C n=1 Tax=Saltatorellus ferox TaxID=2528018 RepID=A0A518EQ16_9BACT|nr:Planctomycete cytochrome C [Planctomycetes bacterium Poly30]